MRGVEREKATIAKRAVATRPEKQVETGKIKEIVTISSRRFAF
jgi:hypothetical protein